MKAGDRVPLPFVGRPHVPGELLVVGWVAYTNSLGDRYKTGFCRRYAIRTMEFVTVDNPDYEYQD